ncbi:neutral zinc metallopeptidase [Actinocorallia herbida]|uniref:neutral zinc metallopeptidase n=1 Tax=Actinocorallia herbida TaxID=58109 RepID=UPI0014775285|nr:neutral zinc metallopeptidase [Actinocorallia herbida]
MENTASTGAAPDVSETSVPLSSALPTSEPSEPAEETEDTGIGGADGEDVDPVEEDTAPVDVPADDEDVPAETPSEDFETDVEGAIDAATAYWDYYFPTIGFTFEEPPISPYGPGDPAYCDGTEMALNNAFHCPSEEAIFYDENWMSEQYDAIGDAFVYMVIAHEVGHNVQYQLDLPYPSSIAYELQADCLAGAVLGNPDFVLIEEGDLEELMEGLAAVADAPGTPWYASDAHGTADQRSTAFFSGVEDASTCLS